MQSFKISFVRFFEKTMWALSTMARVSHAWHMYRQIGHKKIRHVSCRIRAFLQTSLVYLANDFSMYKLETRIVNAIGTHLPLLLLLYLIGCTWALTFTGAPLKDNPFTDFFLESECMNVWLWIYVSSINTISVMHICEKKLVLFLSWYCFQGRVFYCAFPSSRKSKHHMYKQSTPTNTVFLAFLNDISAQAWNTIHNLR